jgi:hypothetical protein
VFNREIKNRFPRAVKHPAWDFSEIIGGVAVFLAHGEETDRFCEIFDALWTVS